MFRLLKNLLKLRRQDGHEPAHKADLAQLPVGASSHRPASCICIAWGGAVPAVNAGVCLVKLKIRHRWNPSYVARKYHEVYVQSWAGKGMFSSIIVYNG